MPVYDLYFKRQKRLKGQLSDVYTYAEIPQTLRNQIIHIWYDTLGTLEKYYSIDRMLGNANYPDVKEAYDTIIKILIRELGILSLSNSSSRKGASELIDFFLSEKNTEKVLSIIELTTQYIDRYTRSHVSVTAANDAISELNTRFKEHGVGYEFVEGQIIRIDSELIHQEVVKPALALLHSGAYQGAQDEFLSAFDHYKDGNTKEAMNEALKSFESTLKTICDRRNWTYDPDKSTSSALIDICYKNGLIPKFWQDHMKALRKLLESGVPTGRNKMSGHGQGATPKEVPDYIASYILHMTASAIVFLVNAEREIK